MLEWEDLSLEVGAKRISSTFLHSITIGMRTLKGRFGTGGMSYFSPRYGFVCDQVTNFEVVLAGGNVVSANANVNPDLWFALKGGSNNLGVVTRFDLKTFHQGSVWGGTIYSPISNLDTQIQSFVELNNASIYDTDASMINSYCYTSQAKSWIIANILFYGKPYVNPPIFDSFTRVRPQYLNTLRLTSVSDITSEQVKNTQNGLR